MPHTRDLGTGFVPTGYKVMWRVPHSERGSALESTNVIETSTRKEGSTENAVTFAAYWPGDHCSSARAFAVNPSRLPARPCGLRGLTAKARPSKGPTVPSMQNCARASPLETEEEKKC